ncbi:MAG: helix-turn-helix transcriptional regulator [Clostridium sp.]|nr:helix-turn-helix transcriptional regulator [Clostridium sp.]
MFKLKAERVNKGIKQKELAKELGITPQYLSSIENGKTEPRRDLMIKISKLLEISIQDLFFSEET